MQHFQNLQDRLNEIYSFPSAIIDNDGNILTATAWQDVCVLFHRKNEETAKGCVQSDKYILSHLDEANPAVTYKCPHGLVDNAAPIIIEGVHYGNFFTGQFFLEKPDINVFIKQAEKYGFDEQEYIAAVKKVPVWTGHQLKSYLFFIKGLIAIISESGLKNLREIEARKKIEESEERASTILSQIHEGFWVTDTPEGRIVDVNESLCKMTGYTRNELLKMTIFEMESDNCNVVKQLVKEPSLIEPVIYDSCFVSKNGTDIPIEINVSYLQNRVSGYRRN
jgi:PAS domain S-box-containing protein